MLRGDFQLFVLPTGAVWGALHKAGQHFNRGAVVRALRKAV